MFVIEQNLVPLDLCAYPVGVATWADRMGGLKEDRAAHPHNLEREWVDNSMLMFYGSYQILHRKKICMIFYIHHLMNFN